LRRLPSWGRRSAASRRFRFLFAQKAGRSGGDVEFSDKFSDSLDGIADVVMKNSNTMSPNRVLKLAVVVIALGTAAAPLVASDLYLTAAGSGRRDGADWENALPAAALTEAVNRRLQPGGRLLVGGGDFADMELVLDVGGKAGAAKEIVGVDRGEGFPRFRSSWSVDEPTRGKTAVRIGPAASHVTLRHVRISGYVNGVQAGPTAAGPNRTALTFDDVDVDHARHPFYLSDCDDLVLTDCDAVRYSKHGFRFEQGCDRVLVRRCRADCSEKDADWENKTELLPFGFIVNDGGAPNTELRFEDCLAANNLMPLQKNKYKNGDGFVVEANARGVSFVGCRALRNQDGGYDLKPDGMKLENCVAIGNGRNFRIWTTGTLTNCFTGWAKAGVWSNGGPLAIERCTFHELSGAAVNTDDRAKEPVTLKDCLIARTPVTHKKTSHGKVNLEGTIEAGDRDPEYVRPEMAGPESAWDGRGDAMNSRAFAEKGYRGKATP
jgi:hypothetical protein